MNKQLNTINYWLHGAEIDKDELFKMQQESYAVYLALTAIQDSTDHQKGKNQRAACREAVKRQLVKINKLRGDL